VDQLSDSSSRNTPAASDIQSSVSSDQSSTATMTEDYDNEALSVQDEEHMSTNMSLIPTIWGRCWELDKPSDEKPKPDRTTPQRATEGDNNSHADCGSSKFKPALQANDIDMEVLSEDR
jgi:hypothetical protein